MTTSPSPLRPVLSVRRPVAANARPRLSSRITDVSVYGGSTRADGFAIARVCGEDLDPSLIDVQALTAGYSLRVLPECTRHGEDLLLGVELRRDDPRADDACTLRFRADGSTVDTVVAVHARLASGDLT